MDALIIFLCIMMPILGLNYLSGARDQLLFITRPKPRLLVLGAIAVAVFLGLLHLGFPASWALAMSTAGPTGSFLGDWIARGGWIILRFRLFGS